MHRAAWRVALLGALTACMQLWCQVTGCKGAVYTERPARSCSVGSARFCSVGSACSHSILLVLAYLHSFGRLCWLALGWCACALLARLVPSASSQKLTKTHTLCWLVRSAVLALLAGSICCARSTRLNLLGPLCCAHSAVLALLCSLCCARPDHVESNS